MYIEVFLLDNLLMNAVICVLAGAVCGRSIRLGRVLLFSLGGAVYGAAAMYVPVLSMFPCKTILCLAMALVFPYEGLRGYITGLTAILAAALTIGGHLWQCEKPRRRHIVKADAAHSVCGVDNAGHCQKGAGQKAG